MTEQEAIEKIKQYRGVFPCARGEDECLDMAITALEELQQYRAIGTVEECREAKEQLEAAKDDIRKLLSSEYGDSCEFCIQDGNEDAQCCNIGGYGSWCCKNAAWKSHRMEENHE